MDKKYQQILDVVNADIERVNSNLMFAMGINPKLEKDLEKFIKSPSKRIRSLVAILYMRAAKMYLLPEHYELLAAVELIHNASLIHDDVIDDAKLRRSRKTLNEKFDNNLAVIGGDYLLALAMQKLVKIGSLEVLDIFSKTLEQMCFGEADQYFSRYKKTKIEQYIKKSEQKTAKLFESTLHSAVILTDEGDQEDTVCEFANNFGLAFQIRDDLKNVISADKGKNASDIEEGIYNAPIILSDNIDEGIAKTKALINNYVDCALYLIKDFAQSPYKKALIELLELIRNV